MEITTRMIIDSYKEDLQKIVEQLEFCNYKSEGGILKNNVAFIALKELAYGIEIV